MVEVERKGKKSNEIHRITAEDYDTTDASAEKKKEKVFFCSMRLPFGQRGLGLFVSTALCETAQVSFKTANDVSLLSYHSRTT